MAAPQIERFVSLVTKDTLALVLAGGRGSRLGALTFSGGVPDVATTQKLYDNLDFQRAVQGYLLGLPPVNQLANRRAMLTMGPANLTVPIWEQKVDSRTVELTANDNTPYTWFWLDLKNGPLVLEVPPKVLGLIDDMWYRRAGDVGITGPDRGQRAVDEIGVVTLISALQLALAFAVLMASEMAPLREFGIGLAIAQTLARAGARVPQQRPSPARAPSAHRSTHESPDRPRIAHASPDPARAQRRRSRAPPR